MKHTPYSPGETIKSANTNDDIDGLASGANDEDNNKMVLFRSESFDNYFASGGVWTISSGLIGTMNNGVLYYAGVRVPFSGVGSYTFQTNSDTYVDMGNNGVVYYTVKQINETPPDLAPNRARNAIITTDGANIVRIVQKDRDAKGILVYNRKPVAKESSAPRVSLVTSVTTLTVDTTNTDIQAITAQSSSLTINLPAGTPANGQALMFRIRDDGTARSITWNAAFRPIGLTLPTTTTAGKLLYIVARYNQQDSKWDILSAAREG